jgi:hypothetical protein
MTIITPPPVVCWTSWVTGWNFIRGRFCTFISSVSAHRTSSTYAVLLNNVLNTGELLSLESDGGVGALISRQQAADKSKIQSTYVEHSEALARLLGVSENILSVEHLNKALYRVDQYGCSTQGSRVGAIRGKPYWQRRRYPWRLLKLMH